MQSPELQPRRDLTLTHATSLVVGITIGTGVFLKSAQMAQAVGTPALVLCAWAVAGLVALLAALCFAELGAMLPAAGGEYVYLRAAYGEVPGFPTPATASCSGARASPLMVRPWPSSSPTSTPSAHRGSATHSTCTHPLHPRVGPRQLIAVGVIAVFAAINCARVMLGGRVQTALTVTKVLAIAAVAAGVFLFSGTPDAANLAAAPGTATGGVAGFGAALFAALWAYSGWQYCPWPPAKCASRSAICPAPSSAGRSPCLPSIC